MAKENYLGIFRKRGMIVCKIIGNGINYNKTKNVRKEPWSIQKYLPVKTHTI